MSKIEHPKFHYDSEDSNLYLNFGENGQKIELACFSVDGTKLLTVKEVGTASVWDVASRTLLQEIHPTSPLAGKEKAGPYGSEFMVFIEAVALNNDGSLALLGLNDGTAGIFSTQDGARLSTFYPLDAKPAEKWSVIRAVNFSPDGSLALVGFFKRSVGVWRVLDNALVQFLSGLHSERLFGKPFVRDTMTSAVAASQDNQYVFAGFADGTATIWKIENKEVIFDAFRHVEKIIGFWTNSEKVRWATTGGSVWEGSVDRSVVHRLSTGENWQEASFSFDGQELLVKTIDSSIKRWSTSGNCERLGQVFSRLSNNAKTVSFGREKELILYVEGEKQLTIKTSKKLARVERDSRIDGFALSPQEDMLATYGWSSSVELWEIPSGESLHIFDHHESVSTVVFSNDGKLLAVGIIGTGGSGTIRPIYVWNLHTGKLLCELKGHEHQVHALAFGPNNEWVVSASLDRTVRVWHLDHNTPSNSSEITQLKYEDLVFHNLVVLSDGRVIVFRRNKLEVWYNQQKLEIPVPHYFQNQWRITEDESYILGSFSGQEIRKWSLDTGQEAHIYQKDFIQPESLPNSTITVNDAGFQPAARCYLWHTKAGSFAHVRDGPRGWATPITLSANGKFSIVPGVNNAALIDLSEAQEIASIFPFEGKLRASRILEDQVLMVNSAGKLFINRVR